MDCLLVQADSSKQAYQKLSNKYSAIEPPTWALLLAESCRSKGFSVGIMDCCAEKLTEHESLERIKKLAPRIVLFVVYGQNPNAGTTSMIGATSLAKFVKSRLGSQHISFVGSHVSALPRQVLSLDFVDSVLLNEGVYALHNLLSSDIGKDLGRVRGIGYKTETGEIKINEAERIVPQERMDEDLPGYAWDLLPYEKNPMDLYRSHVWHGDFNEKKRTPYAAIYTSLGCIYGCEFCMINIVNRTDTNEGISAADSRYMRYWSVEWVLRQFQQLSDLGVKTIRISDEMFLLNHRYYLPICEGLIELELDLHMWAYSRIDTVRPKTLETLSKAGISWLALGIEAGEQTVRTESSKGSFKDINIKSVVKSIQDHGISVIANYIVGLPSDNYATMNTTLSLALELNTEMMNIYPCQALPGSPLYLKHYSGNDDIALEYERFAFLSFESKPLPTEHLSSEQVLEFRDYFWKTYFSHPAFLRLVEERFGTEQRLNVEQMAKNTLRRRILEVAP